MLRDHEWQLKYTPDDGDLIARFYVPALQEAERYDRLTGYFNAGAFALAARGIEGLVRNKGHMRLVVGCTLDPPEVQAIEEGEELRPVVEQKLSNARLAPPDAQAGQALELLAWMVAHGYLDVKVAVPCDAQRRPVLDAGIFHEKSGVIEDRTGEKIAWTGSLNETAAGWRTNWETLNVSTSWRDAARVAAEERNFARLWAGQSTRVILLDVPRAVGENLLRFLPADDRLPKRLLSDAESLEDVAEEPPPAQDRTLESDQRAKVWDFIREAPKMPNGGARVGEATSAVTPWPHQVRAFSRLYDQWPPRLLIADEVGLGKTIQAGMLLRQAWLAGRAERVLILAPKAVLRQWQIELREKFNLNWPIYDQGRLTWYPSPAMQGRHEQDVAADAWHQEPAVIASSQLMRRRDRAVTLLAAEPWDLVVLDEAHHARRQGAGAARDDDRPNALLDLMRGLRERTTGLVLLTATPMQVQPVEIWDLLDLLGLPPEWTAASFLSFFDDVEHPNPSTQAMDRMAALFQAVERSYGAIEHARAQRLMAGMSRLKANKVLRALRDASSIPRRTLENRERDAALAVLRAHTPIRHLVSRHTRDLLRRYYRAGMIDTAIAEREVEDRFIELTAAERGVYEAVEDYIGSTYNQAESSVRNAVGFVMTVYRRRLASSFQALGATLRKRVAAIGNDLATLGSAADDVPDDEAAADLPDADDIGDLERDALVAEEQGDIADLLAAVDALPVDSKLGALVDTLDALRDDDYGQVMVFTQYADTMDFLREHLRQRGDRTLMCYSGRGGEIPDSAHASGWRTIARDDAKRRFREGAADVLLCTDAAAEGLNFQFCGALVNYDMPWNPMRVEQRIGRIDRLGQGHARIRIVNLHYEDTVETDVYRALRDRIGLFEAVVGKLQPILARLPSAIGDAVLAGDGRRAGNALAEQLAEVEAGGFDIDAVLDEDVAMPERPEPPLTMDYLDGVIASPQLMPPGVRVRRLQAGEYALQAPGMRHEVRVTTDAAYYEEHAESVEFWSPGGVVFGE